MCDWFEGEREGVGWMGRKVVWCFGEGWKGGFLMLVLRCTRSGRRRGNGKLLAWLWRASVGEKGVGQIAECHAGMNTATDV